ncbi:hypothetical protein [Bacillus cereus]|uniref:hypothetical protein n=1 Tax=Bacillus cereus TaxID=1396 RepID=UPI0018DEDB41|nr:hypothetical protein [Bacillus cereus]
MKDKNIRNSINQEQSGIFPKPIRRSAANARIGTEIWIPSTTKKYCPLTTWKQANCMVITPLC